MASTRVDPLIGRLFAGRYRVESLIATGGMGKVYRARQQSPDRLVALKVVRGDLAAGANAAERFRRELSATALIEHPHTVRVYDFGQATDGELFYAMELLQGETLRQAIAREGALAPDRAVRIARQAAKALGAAHDKGIVHRDIKPDNLMLTSPYGEQDYVKVLDFGLARFAEGAPEERRALTATGLLLGTPDYMAPEQAEDGLVDGRTDLYALGCVLYQAVTGSPPFSATTPLSLLYKHLHETPRPPSALMPRVPAALDALILRLLAKSPADRHPSANAVIVALDEVARSMGLAPADTTPFERPRAGTHVVAAPEVDDRPTEVVPTPTPLRRAAAAPEPVQTDAAARPRRVGMMVAAVVVPLTALAVGIFAGAQRDDRHEPAARPPAETAEARMAPGGDSAPRTVSGPAVAPGPSATPSGGAAGPAAEPPSAPAATPPVILARPLERRDAETPAPQGRRVEAEAPPLASVGDAGRPAVPTPRVTTKRPRPTPLPDRPRALEPW